MLTQATVENLRRKAAWADHVQIRDGVPLFSWLDLSVTELCNRSHGSPKACSFCPRIDPTFYPNQHLHMTAALAEKMASELHGLEYEGAIILCGFGEPLLHPNLESLVAPFKGLHVEIVTNGDRLTSSKIESLVAAGLSYFVVSMYDGPHQVEQMWQRFDNAGLGEEWYVLRDRWYGADQDFGLKLTNRAGSIEVGNQAPVDTTRHCFYPSYQMSVDWNGDVLLCVQDWHKKLRFGNIGSQTLMECWTSKALHKRRMQVGEHGRLETPCNGCNADGCMHGADHFKAWRV